MFKLMEGNNTYSRNVTPVQDPKQVEMKSVTIEVPDKSTDMGTHVIKKELVAGQLQQRQEKNEMTNRLQVMSIS